MTQSDGVTISADNPRSIHAVELAATAASWGLSTTSDGTSVYRVPSQANPNNTYTVTVGTCSCQDFIRGIQAGNPHDCKHILAVRLYRELVKAQSQLTRPKLRVVS